MRPAPVKDFVVTKIITAGITWLIGLLNPAAAFIKACKLIYDVVMFFVSNAERIAKFPVGGLAVIKDRVNAIALAPIEVFRRDSDLFGEGMLKPEAQSQIESALKRGFQTRDAEMNLAQLLGKL